MYDETIGKLTGVAKKKLGVLNESRFKYLVSSAFAGAFIGVGILLAFTVGGLMTAGGSPATKILMGLSFSVALSLVIFTGTDLFTGNNLVMTVGYLNKAVSMKDLTRVWVISYIGNFIGAIILSFIFVYTGLVDKGPVMEFFASAAVAKAAPSFIALFMRGVLCNFLVCLAVLISFRTENDAAKLIMITMCLFAFITSGFEHSIANMTVYSVGLISKSITGVTMGQLVANLVPVTLGNIVGGGLILGGGAFALRSGK